MKTNNSQTQSAWLGPFYITLATIFFTVMALGIRLSKPYFRADVLVFYRAGFQVLLFMPWILSYFHRTENYSLKKKFSMHLMRGFFGLSAMMCLYSAIQVLPLALANLLGITAVFWAAIIARIFLKEPFTQRQLLWLGVTSLGLVITILSPDNARSAWVVSGVGVFLAILGSMLRGTAITVVRRISQEIHIKEILFFFGVVLLLGSAPSFFLSPQLPQSRDEVQILLVMAVSGTMGQFFLTLGSRFTPALVGAAVTMQGIVWSLMLGFYVLSEEPPHAFFVGSALVIFGVLGLIQNQKRARKNLSVQALNTACVDDRNESE